MLVKYDCFSKVPTSAATPLKSKFLSIKLIALAEQAHQPMRPGEIYDKKLTDKDHRQAPHGKNVEFLKSSLAR